MPSLTPRVAAGTAAPQWGQAFVREGFFWIFALASVAFAITLTLKFWWMLMVIAMPFYFVALAIVKKKDRGAAAH